MRPSGCDRERDDFPEASGSDATPSAPPSDGRAGGDPVRDIALASRPNLPRQTYGVHPKTSIPISTTCLPNAGNDPPLFFESLGMKE